MEEAETIDQFLEFSGFTSARAESGVCQGTVGFLQVFLESLRRLHGHLDRILDDRKRELLVWL
jgi:hypothetical protein